MIAATIVAIFYHQSYAVHDTYFHTCVDVFHAVVENSYHTPYVFYPSHQPPYRYL